MFLGIVQDHHHHTNARHEKRLSVQLVGTFDEIQGHRKKVRVMLGPSQRRENPHGKFRKPLSETTRGLFVHQGNPGAFRSSNSTENLVAVKELVSPAFDKDQKLESWRKEKSEGLR